MQSAFRFAAESSLQKEHYNLLQEVAGLTHTARNVNDQLVSEARGPAVAEIQGLLDGITAELAKVSADDALRKRATGELTKLLGTAMKATSIAHIAQGVIDQLKQRGLV